MSILARHRYSSLAWLRWLPATGVYLGLMAIGNLAWEFLQLPLYTIGQTGTAYEQVFAALHCTLGDILIAFTSLLIALLLVHAPEWPLRGFWMVAAIAIVCGLGYTIYSEWLNVAVRASWTYAKSMPVVSLYGLSIGLSPLLQWLILPIAAFAAIRTISVVQEASS